MKRALLLVGHGTVEDPADIPEFLRRIRHGRPASAEFVGEIRRRYSLIGRSPLLDVTKRLERSLEAELRMPVRTAMRFWSPLVEPVTAELARAGVDEVAVVPVAPFSVHLYVAAVAEALAALAARGIGVPALRPAEGYGSDPVLVEAHARTLGPWLDGRAPGDTALLFSAHSLPTRAISAGDPYQREFEASATLVAEAVGWPASVVYQSQGDVAGEWLGPTLAEGLHEAKARGARGVVVAPIGFLADHVETLYDLDVEAAGQAEAMGLDFVRVPALNDDPALVAALAGVARRAFGDAA